MGRSAPSSVSVDSTIVDNEVADVEMLLEAYYMHIDSAFNRLQVREGLRPICSHINAAINCTHFNAAINCTHINAAFNRPQVRPKTAHTKWPKPFICSVYVTYLLYKHPS